MLINRTRAKQATRNATFQRFTNAAAANERLVRSLGLPLVTVTSELLNVV